MNLDFTYLEYLPILSYFVPILFTVGLIVVFLILFFPDVLIDPVIAIYNWLFRYDIFGNCDPDYDKYKVTLVPNKVRCHPTKHKWSHMSSSRKGWGYVNDKPCGQRIKISDAIIELNKDPNKSETKSETLLAWQKDGYNVVFTSCNNWRCSNCGDTIITEFYCNPSIDNISMNSDAFSKVENYYDILKDKKKQTQQITTRREVAVEPVKKYT